MEPIPNSPIKKKSKHLGLIFGGLILFGVIVIVVSGGSSSSTSTQNSVPVSPSAQTAIQAQQNNTLSNDNSYVNSNGNVVHSPAYSNTVPVGATAKCQDGTYSFSQSRSGTCSHHGGVAQWL